MSDEQTQTDDRPRPRGRVVTADQYERWADAIAQTALRREAAGMPGGAIAARKHESIYREKAAALRAGRRAA